MPTSGELKAELDRRQIEREAILDDHNRLRNELVEVWDQGGKAVETASNKVAACAAKLAAVDTMVARAQAAYDEQLAAEQTAEYNALDARLEPLRKKRELIIANQVAAERTLRNTDATFAAALANAQGYQHSADNVEPANTPEARIITLFSNAAVTLDSLISALDARQKAAEALIAIYKQRLAVGKEIRSVERQAFKLADELGVELDDRQPTYQPD